MSIRPGRFLSIAIASMWLGLLGLHISQNYARSETATLVDLSASSGPDEAELTQREVFYLGERSAISANVSHLSRTAIAPSKAVSSC